MQGSGEQFPPGDGAEELPGSRAPHRVIGTPPPARARTLLEAPPQEDAKPERWLPAEPSDLGQAKRAERLVAAPCGTRAVAGGSGRTRIRGTTAPGAGN